MFKYDGMSVVFRCSECGHIEMYRYDEQPDDHCPMCSSDVDPTAKKKKEEQSTVREIVSVLEGSGFDVTSIQSIEITSGAAQNHQIGYASQMFRIEVLRKD